MCALMHDHKNPWAKPPSTRPAEKAYMFIIFKYIICIYLTFLCSLSTCVTDRPGSQGVNMQQFQYYKEKTSRIVIRKRRINAPCRSRPVFPARTPQKHPLG
ncbi:hypothetical protein FKM82_007673 [Ascaphus truei]